MYPNYAISSFDNQFDALIYPESHPNVVSYLRNQFTNISDTLVDSAKSFMARGKELFEQFHSNEALRFARSAVSEAYGDKSIENDYICSIFDLNRFQTAGLTMQRWIMANPVIREMYHEQRCDGYSSSYVDLQPEDIGESHYDYRRIMDGTMVITDDGWKVTQYLEELKEGDRDLLLEERTDILHTHTWLEYLLELGKEDPTSLQGDML